mmetsp:Transcript_5346/g.6852  ORF Transcript_5346/g.6852 Transcript_5346/m.6852 type:complete len:216 (-) Transcript_5346:204-851(-)
MKTFKFIFFLLTLIDKTNARIPDKRYLQDELPDSVENDIVNSVADGTVDIDSGSDEPVIPIENPLTVTQSPTASPVTSGQIPVSNPQSSVPVSSPPANTQIPVSTPQTNTQSPVTTITQATFSPTSFQNVTEAATPSETDSQPNDVDAVDDGDDTPSFFYNLFVLLCGCIVGVFAVSMIRRNRRQRMIEKIQKASIKMPGGHLDELYMDRDSSII